MQVRCKQIDPLGFIELEPLMVIGLCPLRSGLETLLRPLVEGAHSSEAADRKVSLPFHIKHMTHHPCSTGMPDQDPTRAYRHLLRRDNTVLAGT